MNEAIKIGERFPGPVGNPEVIALLEQMLAAAAVGEIMGVAVITSAGPGNSQAKAGGGFFGELFLGCALMQDAIKEHAKGVAKKPATSLLVPRRM